MHSLFASGLVGSILKPMTKARDIDWSGCPVRYAVGIFGDRWSLLIVRDIMFKGRRHFGDFMTAGEGISTNILADRLARLEQAAIITRHADPSHGSKVVYVLTEKGLALMPTMLAMMEWSQTFDPQTEVPKAFARALRTDREALQRKLLASIEERDAQALGHGLRKPV